MRTSPIVNYKTRENIATLSRLLMSPFRAIAWIVGTLVGNVVAGFYEGFTDSA